MKIQFYHDLMFSREFVNLVDVLNIRMSKFFIYIFVKDLKRPITYPLSKIHEIEIRS